MSHLRLSSIFVASQGYGGAINKKQDIKTKLTSWLLVRKRSIATERPPLVGEF
jgi:hypothetical protein